MATFSYAQTSAEDELIDRVEYQADKVTPTGQSVGINRESVYQQLGEAGVAIVRQAPRRVLKEAASDGTGQPVTNPTSDYTEIELPGTFLRFLSLKLAEWNREIFQLVDERSNVWRLQRNTQTRADIAEPKAAILAAPTKDGAILRAYPQDSTPTIDRLVYITETPPEDFPDELVDPMVLRATGRVLQAQKEAGAEAAYQKAARQLQNLQVGQVPMIGTPAGQSDDE